MQEPIAQDSAAAAHHHFGPVGQTLFKLTKLLSIAGGLVFVLLVIMSIVSITGRKLFASPIPGDVELLEVCSAFAAASFFAYCHLNGGDVKVDFFTAHASRSTAHALDAMGSMLVAVFGGLITWRASAAALSVKAAGDTTMILGLPLWWGQILMIPGFVLLCASGLYMCAWHLSMRSQKELA